MEIRENRIDKGVKPTTRLRLNARLVHYQRLNKTLRYLKRLADYWVWRSRVAYRERRHPFEHDRVIWVAPALITYCTVKEFDPIGSDGLVLDGAWDRSEKLFENLDVFHAFKDHFGHGLPWEETEFYRNTVHAIEKGLFYWGCRNENDFRKRCEKLEGLYFEISRNGYRSQKEINPGFTDVLSIDEISVNVDRQGQLLFNNGAHRLSIAKLLLLPKIPVRITVWHKQCAALSCAYSRGQKV